IRRLLQIPGVKGLYHCLDFLALQRIPSADWQTILGQVREILSGEEGVEEGLPPRSDTTGKAGGRPGPSAAGSPALSDGADASSAFSAGSRSPRSDTMGEAGCKIFIQF